MILLTDAISQSSNFCWIVLDETTYYISAFAVDSNGTIIDVQTNSITTAFFYSKYQRVEYITSDRYQRIDTWYKWNYNTAFEMKVRMTSAYSWSSNQMWPWWDMWSQSDYNSIQFVFWTTSSTNVNNRFWWSIVALNWNNTSVNVDYTVHTDKNKFTLNWTQMTRTWSVWTFSSTDNNLRLLQVANKYWEEWFVWRTYYAKIRDNGTLIRDFVPAYRKSDNVIWMVEKVSKTFYTNKWSWTFGKWSNIPR